MEHQRRHVMRNCIESRDAYKYILRDKENETRDVKVSCDYIVSRDERKLHQKRNTK